MRIPSMKIFSGYLKKRGLAIASVFAFVFGLASSLTASYPTGYFPNPTTNDSVIADSASRLEKQSFPSLMWEITGPNMSDPSYLYGSMHVSRKLAFHLGDTFFLAMRSVDVVALELNPAEWIDHYTFSDHYRREILGSTNHLNPESNKQFYRSLFFPDLPTAQTFTRVLNKRHNVMDHLLYRKRDATTDFEEMTYLDLFIFQAAVKMGKVVIGMEDFDISREMVERAMVPPTVQEKQRDITREQSTVRYRIGELIEDAYRKGDLDLLDSLLRISQPAQNYQTWMLYKRNEVMVSTLDSVIRSGSSVFAAAGAAHLAGDSGMIMMLRDMGYTVRPVTRHINRSQHKAKEKIDQQFIRVPLTTWHSPDGDFTVSVPQQLYSSILYADHGEYYYPDMVNGSFYAVSRFPTYGPLRGHSADQIKARFDSLLYEFVPGTISRLRDVEVDGFPGYDITSILSRGDIQRFRILFTPMEVMVFKMSGPERYMKKHRNADRFLSSLRLHIRKTHQWKQNRMSQSGFSVLLPPYHITDTSQTFSRGPKDLVMQAYDFTDSNYYMLIKGSYHDFEYLEEDDFELLFMAERLADSYDLELHDKIFTSISSFPAIRFRMAKSDKARAYQGMIVIRGPEYFLLLADGQKSAASQKFFDSFTLFQPELTGEDFQKYRDTVLLFEVMTAATPPERKPKRQSYWLLPEREVDNSHKSDRVVVPFFHHPSAQLVRLEYIRHHKYIGYSSLAEMWNHEMSHWNEDSAFTVREVITDDSGSVNSIYIVLGDSGTSRTIHHKTIQQHGVVYRLSAVSDTLMGPSPFITELFNSFTPFPDTLAGWSVFEDKGALFLKDLNSEDSVTRAQARESAGVVKFHDHNAPMLINQISTPRNNEHTFDLRRRLILALGKLTHPDITSFLEAHYKEIGDTVSLQISILQALAFQQSEEGISSFLACLSHDIPLIHKSEDIDFLFGKLHDSLEVAAALYPEILKYSRYREYEESIYRLMARLVDSNLLSNQIILDQYPDIYRNARDSWRRHLVREESEQDQLSLYYSGRSSRFRFGGTFDRVLMNYVNLLLPLYTDKEEVRILIANVLNTRTPNLKIAMAVSLWRNGIKVSDSISNELSHNQLYMAPYYIQLAKAGLENCFSDSIFSQQLMARSLLFRDANLKPGDSLIFIERQLVHTRRDSGYVYFFERKAESDRNQSLTWIGVQPLDTTQIKYDDYLRNSQGTRIYVNDKLEDLIELEMKKIATTGRQRATGIDFRKDNTRYLWY
jgi:uncharacterized protein YbaP (TraB family)